MNGLLLLLVACGPTERPADPDPGPETQPRDAPYVRAVTPPTLIDFPNCIASPAEAAPAKASNVQISVPALFMRMELHAGFVPYASDVKVDVRPADQQPLPCLLRAMSKEDSTYFENFWIVPPNGMRYPPSVSDGAGTVSIRYLQHERKLKVRVAMSDEDQPYYKTLDDNAWHQIPVPRGESNVAIWADLEAGNEIFLVSTGASVTLVEHGNSFGVVPGDAGNP